MKKLLMFCFISILLTTTAQAQSQKIMVSEDAFTEGGPSTDKPMGKELDTRLRIFNSSKKNQWGRITYLKFNLPKNLENLKEVTLNIMLRVFPNKKQPELKFNLDVFLVEDNNWSENTITLNNAPKKSDILLGTIEIDPTKGKKGVLQTIKLDANTISDLLKTNKDRTLSLALYNTNFNKVSAQAPSKDRGPKFASYLLIE